MFFAETDEMDHHNFQELIEEFLAFRKHKHGKDPLK